MVDESFIILNLQDSQAKKMAQVISNETSRKILDFLTQGEATESTIAKALNVPISTVHYNLKLLAEVKLVQATEFHYSAKGRAVDHYKLANKFVIIAPERPDMDSLKQRLARFLPVIGITLVGAALVQMTMLTLQGGSQSGALQKTAIENTAADAAPMALRTMAEPVMDAATTPSILQNYAFWFIVGALSVVLVYLAVEWFTRYTRR